MANVTEHLATAAREAAEHAREAAESVTNKVTDFLQGNPFETPIGRKIEMATDSAKLSTENWGLNMEICDFINYTNEGGRDAIRAIRKRLQTQIGKNNANVMYTLTVLETAVKNCDQRFVALVCQKEFVSELVKLISAKYEAPQIVQERVLGLIQSWTDTFRGNPACSGVVEAYDELKGKGVEFPETNLDTFAPIITPKRTVFPNNDASKKNLKHDYAKPSQKSETSVIQPAQNVGMLEEYIAPTQPINATPEQMAKLRSELDMVNVNIEVFRELIANLKPKSANGESSNDGDFQLIQELNSTCREMQKRILELIPILTNEEITYELLTVNDELNTLFEKYDRHASNPTACGSSADLIDFGGRDEVLNKQFNEINVQDKNSFQVKNTVFINDQTDAGLRTAAFDKTSPISERRGQENTPGKDDKKDPQKFDDGL